MVNKTMNRSQYENIRDTKRAQQKISVAVVSSYIFKAAIKLTTGVMLSIPPLVADGIHSIIDIFEHGALLLAGRHARKADREKYPLDREPLIELIGLAIFLGLFFLGLRYFFEAIGTFLAILIKAGWIKLGFFTFIDNLFQDISIPETNLPWFAAIILAVCFAMSEIVHRFQLRLAKEHGLREMEADAIELRSDGWVELAMAIGFTTGWLITMVLVTDSSSIIIIYSKAFATEVILLALSIYLMKISIPEIFSKYQNLMNVAINPEKRELLENVVNKRLPKNCTLVTPLTTFYRGEQLFITGRIRIDRSVMLSADVILSKAERIAGRFLSDISKNIRVQFSPFFVWDRTSIEKDLDEVVRLAWIVPLECTASRAFHLLRKGNLAESIKMIDENTSDNPHEIALANYVRLEILVRTKDILHFETDPVSQEIEDLIDGDRISISVKVMLASWLLFYATDRKDTSEGQSFISSARDRLETLLNQNSSIPDIVQAEASFALGYSWERCHNYDVQKAVTYYRQSEAFYAKSGIRSESDRLMNTWGHLESMLYALGDAHDHLEVALDIRKLRDDPLSLSFTYGCLGDLLSRLGNFEDADHYYSLDFDILRELNIKHMSSHVMCKQGEARIRWGLVEGKPEIVKEGINLCKESEQIAGIERREALFFAKKGQLKGWLGLAAISDDKTSKDTYSKHSSRLLEDLDGKNPYEEAFVSRLKGRYFGQSGETEYAYNALNDAAFLFHSMREPNSEIGMSLQTIACRLEILKFKTNNSNVKDLDLNVLDEFENFLDPLGGMLGELSNRLRDLLSETRADMDSKPMNKEKIVMGLDHLVWLIEV